MKITATDSMCRFELPDSLRGPSGGAGLSSTFTVALATAEPSSLLTSKVYLPASDLSENWMSKVVWRRVVVMSMCSLEVTTMLLMDHLTKGLGEPWMGTW